MKKIVIAGPPRSGKSCMCDGLRHVIHAIHGAPYVSLITACPDGEGLSFRKIISRNPKVALARKAFRKGVFTSDFVDRMKNLVEQSSSELTLVDIGGIVSSENEKICSGATHIMILFRDDCRISEWHEFAKKVGLSVIAEIYSDYHGTEDKIEQLAEDGVFRGSVHHLERGGLIVDRPMVKALAKFLVGAGS